MMKRLFVVLIIILVWGCATDKTATTGPPIGPTDTISLHVIAFTPVDGDSSQPTNAPITATFSSDIDTTTLGPSTFRLNHDAAGTIAYKNRVVTFRPGPILLFACSTYTVTVTTGLKNMSGNCLAAPFQWSFKTVALDLIRPTIVSTYPVAGDTLVHANAPITVTFSKIIDPASVTPSTFYLNGAVKGTIQTSGKTITFNPAHDLTSGIEYTATVSGAVADRFGNTLGGPYTWSFKTIPADRTPPSVVTTIPANGATGVSLNTSIEVAFSERVDPSTITSASFQVSDGVTGNIAFSGDTVLFVPSGPLLPMHSYTVTISTNIADYSGNHFQNAYTFGFTTERLVIMPLAVGNFWEYHVLWNDTAHYGDYYDTTYIIRDTLIRGEDWFVDNHRTYYANRDDGLYILSGGMPTLAFKFPTSINDSFPSPYTLPLHTYETYRLVVHSLSEPVTVPAGTYNCVVYRSLVEPIYPSGFADYHYCPNVGMVQFLANPGEGAMHRLGYRNVNKMLTKVEIHGIGK
jgi:hypothetical protein